MQDKPIDDILMDIRQLMIEEYCSSCGDSIYIEIEKFQKILEKHLIQSEKVDQYDMGFERGRQIGYKEGHRDTIKNIVNYGFKQSEKVVYGKYYCSLCKEDVELPHTCGSSIK